MYCSARTRASQRPYCRLCPVSRADTVPLVAVALIVSMPCWSRTSDGRLSDHIRFTGEMKSSYHWALPHRKIFAAFVGYGAGAAATSAVRAVAGTATRAARVLSPAARLARRNVRVRGIRPR